MRRRILLGAGGAALAAAWLGPLPGLAPQAFVAHMGMHVLVVAVAAPLLAAGLAGSRHDPARRLPWLFAPLPAALIEFAVIWAWHAPWLHHAARHLPPVLAVEQLSFLGVGLLLWLSALGGGAPRAGRLAGAAALLLTSMHMTLLGTLLALAPRSLYPHAPAGVAALSSIEDQQLGGLLMLGVAGATYLAGGLCLLAGLLRNSPDPARQA